MASSCEESEVPVQIDRMGRAGVNTAITDPFFRNSEPAELARHNEAALDYNGNDSARSWNPEYNSPFQTSLAILDSLDTVCGNQLVADQADDDRYAFLATVLTDDKLYVNTDSGTCEQYLAVEGNAVGVTNTDCGGRTPLHDTIDTTYSVLAIGALSGVGDGVAADTVVHSNSVFPFLAAPLGSGMNDITEGEPMDDTDENGAEETPEGTGDESGEGITAPVETVSPNLNDV